VQKVSVLTK